jgi:hypothetical protein
MRRAVDEELIRTFLRAFGAEAKSDSSVYFTGGVTAVLYGWRESTVALDIKIVPEQDSLFRAIPNLKESLSVNIELASPADFLPELPGWPDRSKYIAREGQISFFHYDLYSQALSKVERGHVKDLEDVRAMIERNLILPEKAIELFHAIEPHLFRFPAIDPKRLRRLVESAFVA